MPGSTLNRFSLIRHLRAQAYDTSICAFPNVRPGYNLLAYSIGADRRITHSYQHSKLLTLSFLQNVKVPARSNMHDIENNLLLLEPFGITPTSGDAYPSISLSEGSETFANNYLERVGMRHGCYLIGVHAGSGPLRKKRWGVENFAAEVASLTQHRENVGVLLFGDRSELDLNTHLAQSLVDFPVAIPVTSFKNVCSLIKRCDFFLSNDSSLMHVAAAFGLNQKAIFLASNPVRTRPWNDQAEILIPNELRNYGYPFDTIFPRT